LILEGGLLAHYSPTRQTRIETDASNGVSAGVLHQLQDDKEWKPVAFFTKTMAPEEIRYEIHDKEMLAVMRGLEEWRPELIGLQTGPFLIITDHKALEYFTTKRLLNARQARWADKLADYHFQITYRPGASNVVADALSRKQDILRTQKDKDTAARTTTLLPASVIAIVDIAAEKPQVVEDLPNDYEPEKTQEPLTKSTGKLDAIQLIDRLLHENRTHKSLAEPRELAL
jgi:hypothetical protein